MNARYKRHCQLGDLADSAAVLTQIRRHLHQHPELSFKEAATSELVAGHLAEWGYEVTRNIGGHGVVGSLKRGDGTRSVSLRADMDALPIVEETGLPHASRHAGAMHACGHDGHTTMLLGAARHLAARGNFSGTVHLVFQPAEEAGRDSGAQRMIADGLFDRFPCDAIFGLHNHPGFPAGTFMFGSGPFMSASDTVHITIRGRGGHAARPHLTVDPVLIAGSLVMALQTVVSRNIDPTQTAVLTIGSLHAGNAANVIPESATLALSVRSFSEPVRTRLRERITELVTLHVQGYGGSVPETVRSGKHLVIHFRFACNTTLRAAIHQLAFLSLPHSTWARAYYDSYRERGHTHHEALRALGAKWLKIIFVLWKRQVPYSETHHLANIGRQHLRQKAA